MADKKDIMTQEAFNELLRVRIQLMEDLSKHSDDLNTTQAMALLDTTKLFENLNEVTEKNIEAQKRRAEGETDKKKQAALQAEIEHMKRILVLKKKEGTQEEKLRKLIASTAEQRKKAEKGRLKMLKESNTETDKAIENARKRGKDTVMQIGTVTDALKTGLDTGISAGRGALFMIQGLAQSPHFAAMSLAMTKFGVNMEVSMGAIKAGLAGMAPAIDKNFRGIAKTTGLFSEDLYDTFTYALDPLYAMGKPGLFPEGMERPLINVGITAKETGDAMKGILNNVMLFRPAFMEAHPEAAAFTANLVAGMGKLGVDIGTSTKALNIFTKSLKQTPMQATKSVKSLLSVSKSLGINVGQAMKDFTGLMPTLAQFGDRAVEVFAGLEAQSIATGMAVGELGKLAGRLDTFKGAANAAQAFNAVMGDTLIDVNALVHADPADKISMIQEAMDAAGVSFEDADRRVKQVIASTLGLDVEAAGKLLGGKEDYEAISAGIDTAAMSQEQLEKQIENTMTSGEKLQKNLSSTGGAFREFVKKSRVAAGQGAKTMFAAFEKVRNSTKSSEKSAMGLLGSFTQMANMAADIKNVSKGTLGVAKGVIEATTGIAALGLQTEMAQGLANMGSSSGVLPAGETPAPTPTVENVVGPVRETVQNVLDVLTPETSTKAIEENTKATKKLTEMLEEAGGIGPGPGGEFELKLDPNFGTAVLDNVNLGL
jgi:hypothetical protein